MIRKISVFIFFLVLVSTAAPAQENNIFANLESRPYDPARDPNADLFISNWRESMPRLELGNLVVRDLLTPCKDDPMQPHTRGAVITVIKSLTHAALEVDVSTTPATLKGEQKIFYIESGTGVVKAGNQTANLRESVLFMVPEGLEFTITNNGDIPLTMYVITEPVPDGFKPRKDMLVKDCNVLPYSGTTGHWTHITKNGIRDGEGLATLTGLCPVWYDPMTMGQPHSHTVGTEEIWFGVKGDITLFLGKQLRKLPVGSAYKIPPNGKTPHSNINVSDEPIHLFWLMYNAGGPYEEFANLAPEPFDRKTEPNIDMFMGSYLNNPVRHTHGNLLERDVLTKCDGDPMNPKTKGAVLKFVNRFTHASLMAHNTTTPFTPIGEQELFYVLSGKGTVTGGGETLDIHEGVAFLIPENLEFTMTNTGSEAMTMYVVAEPTYDGFVPKKNIVIRDENKEPFHTSDAHWVNTNKWLVKMDEGLADLELYITVYITPNTFAQPHSHGEGIEEVWCTIYGDLQFLLGKQVRNLPPGTAYLIPPNETTPHANFNVSDDTVKIFYFARGWNK
ncbi:cupin domain-containing protein [Candidatus Latescibacterota bacterium]